MLSGSFMFRELVENLSPAFDTLKLFGGSLVAGSNPVLPIFTAVPVLAYFFKF
jgi:hypothetical protein